MRSDDSEEMLSLPLGELLGIIQFAKARVHALMLPSTRENHGRGHDRSSQWTASRFIDSSQAGNRLPPQGSFEGKPVGRSETHASKSC
jgi:hypothetical protein